MTEHSGEALLLLLLDGELNPRETEAISIHLQRCGHCQATMQQLQKGIEAFLEYSQATLLPIVSAPQRRKVL